jgi:hypothetical protein
MKFSISFFTRIILVYTAVILFSISDGESTSAESYLTNNSNTISILLQFPPLTDNADHYRIIVRHDFAILGIPTDINIIYTKQQEFSIPVSDVWKYYTITIQAVDQYGIRSPESPSLKFTYNDIVTGIKADMEHPVSFALYQNVPNPFNPVTKITFDLTEDGWVSIVVYNISGQVVTKLEDRYLESGTHTVIWNAAGQPSGSYIYHLSTPGYTATRKMLLLK